MMKLTLLLLSLSVLVIACDKTEDQAGATGSGAGIQNEEVREADPNTGREEKVIRQDAGGEDMNITTPIDERPDLEE